MNRFYFLSFLVISIFLCFSCTKSTKTNYEIKLIKAIENKYDLLLILNSEKKIMAITPDYCKVPHQITINKCKLNSKTIDLIVHLTLNPDNFNSFNKKQQNYRFHINGIIEDSIISGFFNNNEKIEGKCTVLSKLPEKSILKIHLIKGVDTNLCKLWQSETNIQFSLLNKKCKTGIITNMESPSYANWSANINECNIFYEGDSIKGNFSAIYNFDNGKQKTFYYSINSYYFGEYLQGTYEVTDNKKFNVKETFYGKIEKPSSKEASFLMMDLHNAINDSFLIRTFISFKGDSLIDAFAVSPTYNRECHLVNLSDLTKNKNQIKGKIKIIILPDDWKPRNKKLIECTFSIASEIQNNFIIGKYNGNYGIKKAKGSISGIQKTSHQSILNTEYIIKMEDALIGGENWQNRAFFKFIILEGKTIKKTFFTNKRCPILPCWEGNLDSLFVGNLNDSIKIMFYTSVHDGVVNHGKYNISLNGLFIGNFIKGQFQSKYENNSIKTGNFIGWTK